MSRTRGPCALGLYRYQQQQIEIIAKEAIHDAILRDIARVRAEIVAEIARSAG